MKKNIFLSFKTRQINIVYKTFIDIGIEVNNKNMIEFNPSKIVDLVINYVDNNYQLNELDGDSVWCILNLNYFKINQLELNTYDEMKKDVLEKIDNYYKNKKIKIKLCVNNPSSMVWFILHKDFDPRGSMTIVEIVNSLLGLKLEELEIDSRTLKENLKIAYENENLLMATLEKDEEENMFGKGITFKEIIGTIPYTELGGVVKDLKQ